MVFGVNNFKILNKIIKENALTIIRQSIFVLYCSFKYVFQLMCAKENTLEVK